MHIAYLMFERTKYYFISIYRNQSTYPWLPFDSWGCMCLDGRGKALLVVEGRRRGEIEWYRTIVDMHE